MGGLGALRLSMEEMLLFTECPLAGDVERSVSEEIVESGRGMYWTVSEKPTIRRDGGLSSLSSDCGSVVCNVGTLVSEAVVRSGGGGSCEGWSRGVVGRLLLSRGSGSFGFMMLLKSLLDMA